MEEMTENLSDKIKLRSETENIPAFKPLINIRRKQTRKITAQVDEEIAALANEYVQFVTECYGSPVSHGEILNEIYKSHFARDSGFKGWRAKRSAKTNGVV